MKSRTIIKAIIIYSLIVILNPLFAFAQPSLKGTWCNGGEFVIFQKKNGKRFLFEGGTFHEGGSFLTLEWIKDNRFKYVKKEYESGYGIYDDPGFKVKEIVIENFINGTFMLALDAKNNVVAVMRNIKENESEFSAYINEIAMISLNGKYKDKKGKIISIDGENMTFDGLGNNKQKFTIPEGMYQFPMSDVIRLENGKTYKYTCKYGKLLIVPIELKTIKEEDSYVVDFEAYEAAGNTDEDPSKVIGDTIVLSKLDDDDLGGYFPVFYKNVIMSNILYNIAADYKETIELLEPILDEIYARNGYSFPNKPKKKALFAGRKWYKPTIDKIELLPLSYTEKINSNSLKKAIKYAKDN